MNLVKITLVTMTNVFVSEYNVSSEFIRLIMAVDDRMMDSIWIRYFADLYNTKHLLFSMWMVVLVCIYSGLLIGILELLDFCCRRISRIIRRKES